MLKPLPTTGGTSMRRLVFAVLPLFALLAGCFKNKERYYTYCDATGCYECDAYGCHGANQPNGGGPNSCRSSSDCAEGCYCNTATGECSEAGFCDKNADCSTGMTCNTA